MNGFSLMECMTALLCLTLMVLIAVGTNTAWLQQQRSQAFITQLVHDLQFARQQAILRKTVVHICPTDNFIQCAESSAWQQGYLIYLTMDEPLLVRKVPRGTLHNSRHQLQFGPEGFTQGTNSTFTYLLGDTEQRVIINLQGRIRVE